MPENESREKIAKIIYAEYGGLYWKDLSINGKKCLKLADQILALLPEYEEATIPENLKVDGRQNTYYQGMAYGYREALIEVKKANPGGLFTIKDKEVSMFKLPESLLTDEEIDKEIIKWRDTSDGSLCREAWIAKVQEYKTQQAMLKWIVEWGYGTCEHTTNPIQQRHTCSGCWNELKKLVK